MEKKMFPYIDEKDGFVFFDGKLQEVELKSQTIFKDGNGEWKILLIANTGDDEIEISSDEFYECGIAYQNKDSIINKIQSFGVLGVNEDGTFYTNENGQVTKHVLNPIHIVGTFGKQHGVVNFSCPEMENFKQNNVQIFHSRNVAEQLCDITCRFMDGKENKMTGILRKIMLTDEQKKAVEEFKAAFDKATNLGVQFLYDGDNNWMKVINRNNISDFQTCVDYDLDENDNWIVPEIFEEDCEKEFTVPGVYFGYLCCDYILAVKED